MEPTLHIHELDNVAVVVTADGIEPGQILRAPDGSEVVVKDRIARGHKVALASVPVGQSVVKFGHTIGMATREIFPGDHVHSHNMVMPLSEQIHSGESAQSSSSAARGGLPDTFMGYKRNSGRAGTRNYIVVAASVNCSATVVKAVCRRFINHDFGKREIHGVVPMTHTMGCAQAIGGHGYQVLNRTLAGWIFHPNVVGAVIIGLGCEGTTAKTILAARSKERRGSHEIPIENLGIQDSGGTAAAIEAGVEAVKRLIEKLPDMSRTPIPVAELNIALNCGGSDGLSGITANPALGVASDILVSKGGTVALAEIPECHGAEDVLLSRCVRDEDRKKLAHVFSWWEEHAAKHGAELNQNLAPGNIAGGITTIVEKSLGAVSKAGGSPLEQVVDYAEPITRTGFVLMNTPGFDPVSVTGLVAGGCTLVAFTTGRGSAYGCAIAPTIKIATNSEVFKRMSGDMDVDAGRALESGKVSDIGEEIFRLAVDVASGKRTCSEQLGLGWEEFAPWPVGETL